MIQDSRLHRNDGTGLVLLSSLQRTDRARQMKWNLRTYSMLSQSERYCAPDTTTPCGFANKAGAKPSRVRNCWSKQGSRLLRGGEPTGNGLTDSLQGSPKITVVDQNCTNSTQRRGYAQNIAHVCYAQKMAHVCLSVNDSATTGVVPVTAESTGKAGMG